MTVLHSGQIGWWDPRTGRARTVLPKPRRDMLRPSLSPDGRILASVDRYAHKIDLWSADTLDLIKEMPGGTGPVAFSPDGKTLTSGGNDRTVKLWDVATGEKLLTLEGYRGAVRFAAFSPDGKTLATLSAAAPDQPNEIIVWRAAADEMDRAGPGADRSGKPAR